MDNLIPLKDFDRFAQGILIVDEAGNVRLCDRGAGRLLGWRPAAAVGVPCWKVARLHAPDGTLHCMPDCPIQVMARSGRCQPWCRVKLHPTLGHSGEMELGSILIPPSREGRYAVIHILGPAADGPAARKAEEEGRREGHGERDLMVGAEALADDESEAAPEKERAGTPGAALEASPAPGSTSSWQSHRAVGEACLDGDHLAENRLAAADWPAVDAARSTRDSSAGRGGTRSKRRARAAGGKRLLRRRGAARAEHPALRGTTKSGLLRLSPREEEVLDLLATGLETREIARKLSIAPTTVRNHVQRILEKLRVHKRLPAVLIWLLARSRTPSHR